MEQTSASPGDRQTVLYCGVMHPATFDDTIFSATLVPHRSLSPRGFLLLIGAVAVLWFGISFYFWLRGAWPIIGFGGLDVLALYLAFRINYHAARAREEVAVSRGEIVVRKVAPSGRAQEFRFNPQWVRLEVEEAEDEGVIRVTLRARERRIAVGAFLNPEDRRSFARALGAAIATARA
jgi:uncharacterized membrane protein